MTTETILAIAGLVTAVSVAMNWLFTWGSKVAKPHVDLEKRVAAIEKRMEEHDTELARELNRIKNLEGQNRLIMKSLFALLEHGIDGNNIERMKSVKDEINSYLIEK